MKKSFKLITIVFALCFIFIACGGGEKYYQSPLAFDKPQSFRNITAAELVSEIIIGWNPGNTLDATDFGWLINPTVDQMERAWSNPAITKENINTIKEAGFNSLRLPVTWSKASDEDFNIRNDWMDRVTEIVNYAVENDMYIIINSHHDETEHFKLRNREKEESIAKFNKMWAQIAYNFRNYNEKLIFEALNEPRTKGASEEWSGGTLPEHLILNEYYQNFVDVVRKSGGNNNKRILMVNPYAASSETSAMKGLMIPKDKVKDKIIVSIHAYVPYNFALNQGNGATDKWSIDNPKDTEDVRVVFDRAEEIFLSKGYPVIMGEFGAVDRENEDARAVWAEYYVSYGRSKGIPCFLWDNNLFINRHGERFGFLDRTENYFPHDDFYRALMRGAGVTTSFPNIPPDFDDFDDWDWEDE